MQGLAKFQDIGISINFPTVAAAVAVTEASSGISSRAILYLAANPSTEQLLGSAMWPAIVAAAAAAAAAVDALSDSREHWVAEL